MESKVQQINDNAKGADKEEKNPMHSRVFRAVKLSDFTNYEEINGAAEEVDEEKRAENIEMTEQEIEALQQILNE